MTAVRFQNGGPCVISNEGVPDGMVPFFLPGHNPFMTVENKTYGIPQDAVLGGAKTMYPQYRKQIKDTYARPAVSGRRGIAGRHRLWRRGQISAAWQLSIRSI